MRLAITLPFKAVLGDRRERRNGSWAFAGLPKPLPLDPRQCYSRESAVASRGFL